MDSKKKNRVYIEDVKTEHTTHWDLDYLTQAELDKLFRKNRLKSGLVEQPFKNQNGLAERPSGIPRIKTLVAVLAGSTAALLAVLVVLILG